MVAALYNFVSRLLSLSWLTGPIFDKELRVSSRRRRNYVLRFAYLTLLTVFLVLLWLEEVRYSGSAVNRAARMARAGQAIIIYIVWFQFCATQLVAIIMLSTAISDEIYNRTLGLLMTTPINSFQIVMGKLFSKLLQLILLLAISLPLLTIVRVFGGVPWGYLISSLCITLTTVIFFGSLSLFFSIFSRRAYTVIIMTVLTLAVLFALLPFLTGLTWHFITGDWPGSQLTAIIFCHNPYAALGINTAMMTNPRGAGGVFFSWPIHCGIILAASAFVLFLSVTMVRKVALRQATGQLETFKRRRRLHKKKSPKGTVPEQSPGRIRRINGSPTIWKELRTPLFRGHRIAAFVVISISVLLLLATYGLCALENDLDDEGVHMVYAAIFVALGILFTIILPATCITSEKESRSWPLLLATTLGDWQILFGKFVGILRRCLPIWLFLFGHLILFTVIGYIHPVIIPQMLITVTWIVVFLSSTGLYFSSRFRRSTTAVIMNLALAAVIWVLVPLLLVLVIEATDANDDLVEAYMDTNPFVHALVPLDAAIYEHNALDDYDWVSFRNLDAFGSTCWMLFCMLAYICVGFLFAWRAKCRLRHNIF